LSAGLIAALLLAGCSRTEAVSAAAPAMPAPPPSPARTVPIDAALQARIRARIDAALARAVSASRGMVDASGTSVAVHVREVGTQGELVAIDASRPMRPASNAKLVTSAAALVLLGADGAFTTGFETQAPAGSGVLRGDLVVRAGADPFYDAAAGGSVEGLLRPVVEALRARGIASIEGSVVLDELDYGPPAPARGWPDASQHWNEFCALSGGFSANAGCLTAVVRAGEAGAAARVELQPRGHGLVERLSVTTGGARSGLDVRVGAQGGRALVEGRIPRDVPEWTARFAAPDPVALFGGALLAALESGGIRVAGGVRRERMPLTGSWRTLARLRTRVLDVLAPINTDSNNACADQLFLLLGHAKGGAGTRVGGEAACREALALLGVPVEGYAQADGSGLSRENLVSAAQLTALLEAVLRLPEPAPRAFLDSLAAGGESGTLAGRMQDAVLAGRVRAKTGFIAGTSALAGYLDTQDGRRLAFSILVEYPAFDGLNTSCWKPMQDEICRELATADG